MENHNRLRVKVFDSTCQSDIHGNPSNKICHLRKSNFGILAKLINQFYAPYPFRIMTLSYCFFHHHTSSSGKGQLPPSVLWVQFSIYFFLMCSRIFYWIFFLIIFVTVFLSTSLRPNSRYLSAEHFCFFHLQFLRWLSNIPCHKGQILHSSSTLIVSKKIFSFLII